MPTFKYLQKHIGAIEGRTAAELLSAAADVSLIVDHRGVIRDMSFGSSELERRGLRQWVGSKWADTVALDSRQKVLDLLSGEQDKENKPRQINHLLEDGSNLMVLYSIVPLEGRKHFIAVGKDLSSLEQLQQKLVNVQYSMERDFARLSQFETRYRVLFQSCTEAILVAKADNFRVLEANPAACKLLNLSERKIVSGNLLRCFKGYDKAILDTTLKTLKESGQPTEIAIHAVDSEDVIRVNFSVFKTEGITHILVRLQRADVNGSTPALELAASEQYSQLAALVENAPDALVVTDKDGVILIANSEFLDLAQLASADVAEGALLSKWLGVGVDFPIIIKNLNERGSIRLYKTEVRSEFGVVSSVEVSAANVDAEGVNCLGFSIRNISRRLSAANDDVVLASRHRTNDQLADLVGRVPLKDLVKESTELIEQLCIQAALKRTGNNRASAAEMLGLSRQSLYVKLRLYSLESDDND